MGFCVASTKKGSGSACVSPNTVTRRSCMASNSDDCVLGEARLISSASTRLVKIGPFEKTNCRPADVSCKMGLPVMSPGSKSGVNWIRRVSNCSVFASPLTNSVFPSPGSPSSSKWPRANNPVSTSSISGSLPNNTPLSARRSEVNKGWAAARSDSLSMVVVHF